MSSPHKTFEEASERHERLKGGRDWLVPLAAAIIAVLAALGTLFSHHRSIQALSVKTEALLQQSKAYDQYNYYQAKRIKVAVYDALIASGTARDAGARNALRKTANHEEVTSVAILAEARELERRANEEIERSEVILKSFETLEIATTLFEIAIIFVSISALSQTRILLYLGSGLSVVGIAYMIVGYFQGH